MQTNPVFSLDAVQHKDLYTATKIVNIHDFEYYLWVRVDPEISKYYGFYQLDEVGTDVKFDINLSDICSHEPGRIWYRFTSLMLNTKPGQHVYRMHMVNTQSENTISLYFSYIIQREDPEKPYIYMPQMQPEDVKLK